MLGKGHFSELAGKLASLTVKSSGKSSPSVRSCSPPPQRSTLPKMCYLYPDGTFVEVAVDVEEVCEGAELGGAQVATVFAIQRNTNIHK